MSPKTSVIPDKPQTLIELVQKYPNVRPMLCFLSARNLSTLFFLFLCVCVCAGECQRQSQFPEVVTRVRLERYLTIPGYNCRLYVIQRVRGSTSCRSVSVGSEPMHGWPNNNSTRDWRRDGGV